MIAGVFSAEKLSTQLYSRLINFGWKIKKNKAQLYNPYGGEIEFSYYNSEACNNLKLNFKI